MDGPAIRWSSRRVGVPKLRLQQLSSRGVEAAEIGDGGRVLAADLRVGAGLWGAGGDSEGAGGGEESGGEEGEHLVFLSFFLFW